MRKFFQERKKRKEEFYTMYDESQKEMDMLTLKRNLATMKTGDEAIATQDHEEQSIEEEVGVIVILTEYNI